MPDAANEPGTKKMASILSHPAVPIGLCLALGRDTMPRRLAVVGALCAILPDIDVIGLLAGVPYNHFFGHRGFTHSLVFAAAIGAAGTVWSTKLSASRWTAFVVLFLCTASHGIFDALTNGGLGVAFWSPFSNHRYFFPWQVIEVSPISFSAFFSSWGIDVLASEILYLWIPCVSLGLLGLLVRKWALRA